MGRSIQEQLRQGEFSDSMQGHGLMDMSRFFEDTRHMVVFDVLLDDESGNDELPNEFEGTDEDDEYEE